MHTRGKIDVTMKSISMQKIENLDYLAEHNLFCLMPYYGFIIEDKLRNSDTKDAEFLYKRELEKYNKILDQAVKEGKIDNKERFLLTELRGKVINAMRFEKDGLDVKELEKMGGQVLELKYYDGIVRAEEKAEEKANKKTFFNIMTRCLKKQKDKEDGVNDGIQMCQDILPDWDKNKIQSELTAIQKDLKLDLNISDIFLNIEVMEKISDKNFSEAYKLYRNNESVKDEDKPLEFMKKVEKTLGIGDNILDAATKAVEEFEGGDDPYFAQKLKAATLKTDEYKKIFNSNGEGKQNQNKDINS